MNKSIPLAWAFSFLILSNTSTAGPDAHDVILVGWHDSFEVDRGWHGEPWQWGKADLRSAVSFGPDGGRFEVRTPGAGMAWTRTINPVWMDAFPILQVEYECDGTASAEGFQLLLTDDSTGPVTPNALNPENPLAGEHEAIINLPTEGGLQVFNLSGVYPSDRIARISLRMKAEAGPTAIRIRRMRFMAGTSAEGTTDTRPAAQKAATPLLGSSRPVAEPEAPAWQAVELPAARSVSSARLASALGAVDNWSSGEEYSAAGISFQLGDAAHAALASGVMEEEELGVAGSWRCSELALLLASRVFGNDAPWYSPNDRRRTSITSPHQLVVQLQYADGTCESHFPRQAGSAAQAVTSLPAAYIVPVDAGKTLTRFALVDRMSYGQVFLLAASVRPDPDGTAQWPPMPEGDPSPLPVLPRRADWSRQGNRLTMQNSLVRMVCELEHGLRVAQMELVAHERNILAADASCTLVELHDADGKPMAVRLTDFHGQDGGVGGEIQMGWAVGDPAAGQSLEVRLRLADDGPLAIRAVLRNSSDTAWRVRAVAPVLHGISIASDATYAHYLLGTRNAILSNQDIELERQYGGPCPMALMDVYAANAGGGLGIYTVDPQGLVKTLRFKQAAGRADLALLFEGLTVPPGGELELPEVHLLAHDGDWHAAFDAYRAEARAKFKSSSRLSDTFYCRRDYPLGGTDYLFDVAQRSYTPKRLMDESTRVFGGLDMIDISGWAYHEKTGRVGDYLTNDLGGLDEVRRLTTEAHQAGAKVGLYFEGYLIDKRCRLAERAFPGWQIIRADGKPWWWSGEMEFFACPGVKAWREEMAMMISTVARQTGVDAVYVDQFGISTPGRACWSPKHDHPVPSNPLHEERLMLETIRRALDEAAPNTALYIEYVPPDCMVDLVDSAFDFSMNDRSPGQHPTKLPLQRYAFPELAAFAMVGHGIRPVPFEADDLHRAVFHGMGLWLKGRGESWFSSEFHDLARRARIMFAEHGQVFRSADCTPLVSTLRKDLHANRFAAGGKTIYTLYNASGSTISGDLLAVGVLDGAVLSDLLADPAQSAQVELVARDGGTVIRGGVEPWSTGAYLIQK